jgi:hypothetical protein
MRMVKFWDLSNTERRARVDKLISESKSDIERWLNPLDADGARDHSRSIFTARFIRPHSSVLDIGCGAMALKSYLPAGCTYAPCDLVDRGEGCIVADLNRDEFPKGEFDCIVILGVLEYVYDIASVLKKCRKATANLLLDYNSQWTSDPIQRRNCGWVSDLSVGAMTETLVAADWKNIALKKVVNDRYLYICDLGLETGDPVITES